MELDTNKIPEIDWSEPVINKPVLPKPKQIFQEIHNREYKSLIQEIIDEKNDTSALEKIWFILKNIDMIINIIYLFVLIYTQKKELIKMWEKIKSNWKTLLAGLLYSAGALLSINVPEAKPIGDMLQWIAILFLGYHAADAKKI